MFGSAIPFPRLLSRIVVAPKRALSPKQIVNPAGRFLSGMSGPTAEDPIVVTDDGSVIVCWHAEKEFPYEWSRPLPEPRAPERSVLKPLPRRELYDTFRARAFVDSPSLSDVDELAKKTYTTKHRWFPRTRDKKAKKTPSDREYL